MLAAADVLCTDDRNSNLNYILDVLLVATLLDWKQGGFKTQSTSFVIVPGRRVPLELMKKFRSTTRAHEQFR